MAQMQQVTSKDGTRIAFARTGTGPPLMIVGGALADHHFYSALADELAHHFTVYNIDRRGRGQSGDTAPYAVERELEDLNAIISEAHAPVLMYGHSAGAALALRAAAAGLPIARLMLADPPYTPRSEHDAAAVAQFAEETLQVSALWAAGNHKGSAAFFLSGFGLPDETIQEMLASSAGASMIASARALPYDYAVLGDGLVPVELAASIAMPTLILASEMLLEASQMLAEAMPQGRLQLLDAPTHALEASALAPLLAQFCNAG